MAVSTTDICVIYNPTAGRGRALRRMASLQQVLGNRARFQPSQAPTHAEELAFEAARNGSAIVAAVGGDGTVHEVANGLLRAERPEVALAVLPVGSANDYAHALGLEPEWWLRADPTAHWRAVDVGLARGAEGRERFFVNGLGLGFNGAVTLESQRIGWLQGVPLYTVALFRALLSAYRCPIMSVKLDDCIRNVPTLALSVAIGQREGNFVLAPNAVVDDGQFDYLHAGRVRPWELVRYVPGMIAGKLPTDHPALWTGHCKQVQVCSEQPLTIHLDGEMFCRPEDRLREVDVKILPSSLRVQVPNA
jgi:diacylglycerol kinase family enzyme